MEDPKLAKGIVKREVIRVVTPGTVLDSNLLDAKDNNYLASLYPAKDGFGLSFLDISTGDFFLAEVSGADNLAELDTMLARFTPREIVLPKGSPDRSRTFHACCGSTRRPSIPTRTGPLTATRRFARSSTISRSLPSKASAAAA